MGPRSRVEVSSSLTVLGARRPGARMMRGTRRPVSCGQRLKRGRPMPWSLQMKMMVSASRPSASSSPRRRPSRASASAMLR